MPVSVCVCVCACLNAVWAVRGSQGNHFALDFLPQKRLSHSTATQDHEEDNGRTAVQKIAGGAVNQCTKT